MDLKKQTLSIRSQGALSVETFNCNGKYQTLHYVIKNKTYAMEVVLAGPNVCQNVDLVAELHYDGRDQEVVGIKGAPLFYKGKTSGGGDPRILSDARIFSIDFSLSVLSSHHNDSSFCIMLYAVDRQTGKVLTDVEHVVSAPMQVISKPEVLVKKKALQLRQDQIAAGLLPADSATNSKRKRAPPKSERMLAELNGKVDSVLAHVKRLANAESSRQQGPPLPASSPNPQCGKLTGNKRKHEDVFETTDAEFAHHFKAMLSAFSRISEDERPLKVRKLMNSVSAEEEERAQELCDALRLNTYQPSSQQSLASLSQQLQAPSLSASSFDNIESFFTNFS